MRYSMTVTALASSLVLLAATQLPAKAGPTFDLKSTTGMVELVKSGGGGGGGGGGHMGGGGHLGAYGGGGGLGIGGGHASMGHIGGSMGHMGSAGSGHMGHMVNSSNMAFVHSGNGGNGRHARSFANNNWNGNWNGNWNHNHHHQNRFIVGYPFWYGGGYYANNGYGDCAWLRREAIITGSPYWWRRYQECLY